MLIIIEFSYNLEPYIFTDLGLRPMSECKGTNLISNRDSDMRKTHYYLDIFNSLRNCVRKHLFPFNNSLRQ